MNAAFCQPAQKLYIVSGIDLQKLLITAKYRGDDKPVVFKATPAFISGIKNGDSLYVDGPQIKGDKNVAKVSNRFTGKIRSGLVVVQ